MAKLFKHHFMVVAPTVTELRSEICYTWNYGNFVLTAYFSLNDLMGIWVSDPNEDCEDHLIYYWEQDPDPLTDNECAALISGVKELVESTLKDIHYRQLRAENGVAAALELINAK